ncbi:hypothetical protein D0865_07050 [Hortaea werneckii]|uniref:Zn(2)-C6 fungal-type domain-containing protein n=1 Tax=Hortaea werneckii TaxID=91943 RepID=A0A3M7CDI3_HORWE|nr:hypothetical protein D0865_07050 [Hortaea werneckii]
MQGHWQAPQYASSQPPNITYHFGNAAPPQYAAPPNPMYGPQQQQPAAPPYPQQMYPHMPNQAAPPSYAPIYPTRPMPQHPGYVENARSPACAAHSDSAALPDEGRAYARRKQDSSRPGVDQLADAVGRKVFIDTPTPSPDSTKATGGVPTDVPRRSKIFGRKTLPRAPSNDDFDDRLTRLRELDEQRRDYLKLVKRADEIRAKFGEIYRPAAESWQLHSFTQQQHKERLVDLDQFGRRYLNATDWTTFPENGRKIEQREWMERHGFYVCCVGCRALKRDCSHTYPCSDCRSNGRQCRLAHPGHGRDICRFGMICEEPHDEYFAFLESCLNIPKNAINFWEFPSKLFRQTEHGCQDRNGAPCHARQMPMRGIALPYEADNPFGYTGLPPRWICEEFRPQAD